MPKGGGYGSMKVGDSVATTLKRKPATPWNQMQARPRKEPGSGKFGGLPGGPSGGKMNSGGKSRSGKGPKRGSKY